MTIVEEAINKWLIAREKEKVSRRYESKKDDIPSIWPSDMGGCHRKTALRLLDYDSTLPPDYGGLRDMRPGDAIEDETAEALVWFYGKDNIRLQHILKYKHWSGKPDFILYHKDKEKIPIIIEHKATGEKSFHTDNAIPRRKHIGQLALYGYLYEKKYKVKPELILYYRGWGDFAEIKVKPVGGMVELYGVSNSDPVIKVIDYDVTAEIVALEEMYTRVLSGGTLPDRLPSKADGCSWMGRPSCDFYYHCYEGEHEPYKHE